MLSPASSSRDPGRSRWRRRLWAAVTLLAAFAAVVGLAGLQVPAASAGVTPAAAPGGTAAASRALTASAAAAVAHLPADRTTAAVAGPTARLKPVARTAVKHDISAPLRSLKPPKQPPKKLPKLMTLPLRSPPHALKASNTLRTANVQRGATVTTNTMPTFGQNFEGVGNLNAVFPPDTNMAVGPNDIVQTVNFSFAVYDKSGNTLLGPETLSTLWRRSTPTCATTTARASRSQALARNWTRCRTG